MKRTIEYLEWALAMIDANYKETGNIGFAELIVYKSAKAHIQLLKDKKIFCISDGQLEAIGTQMLVEHERARTQEFNTSEALKNGAVLELEKLYDTCFTATLRSFLEGRATYPEAHKINHQTVVVGDPFDGRCLTCKSESWPVGPCEHAL